MPYLIDDFVLDSTDPFSTNRSLMDSLLLEENSFEVWLVPGASGTGTGTIQDPFVVSTASIFSSLMNSFAPYTTIHLGAGLFPSEGHADGVAGGWQPKPGWRILGAGADLTTIQLTVPSATAGNSYYAIGADDSVQVTPLEIADLTINCYQGAPGHTSIAAGGVKAYGSHIRITRIRIRNFGTLTTSKRGNAIVTGGAFPDYPEPYDCVVDGCTIDQPHAFSVREVACITFAGGERVSDGVMAFHRSCLVRNCLIDGNYIDREAPLNSVTIDNTGLANATSVVSHGRANGEWVAITGAQLNSAPANVFNGSYQIRANPPGPVVTPTTFPYVPVAYEGLSIPGSGGATGDMYIGRTPCQRVAIKNITTDGTYATVETFTPHNRLPAQNAVLNNVGGTPTVNGSRIISDLGSPSASPSFLRFSFSSTPTPDFSHSWLGIDIFGIVVNGGRNIIVESNRILNVTFGVCQDTGLKWGVSDIYVQTGTTKDLTVRDNYFLNVLSAIYFKLGQVSGGDSNQQPTRAAATLTRGGSGNLTATLTTNSPHGLVLGQGVIIAGAKVGGTLSTSFNGGFLIASVPDPKSFTYQMGADPGGNADNPPAPLFGALWQAGRIVIEDNIIELIFAISNALDLPTAIRLDRVASTPAASASPYTVRQTVLRGNVIRHTDNGSDPTAFPMAVQLNSCESAIVEGNVVKLDRPDPIRVTACGAAKFFNNQTPSGALLQGYDTVKQQYLNELTTDADLSAVLAT